MMLQPVSGWEIVTYWILFVGFSLVIIALSISTAVRLNIVRVFLFADEWMSQWSLDTVGFCFGMVHPVSFSFFCHEPSVLTKYLQCWFNTHSESCIKSLSHLSQVEAGSLDTILTGDPLLISRQSFFTMSKYLINFPQNLVKNGITL